MKNFLLSFLEIVLYALLVDLYLLIVCWYD